MGSPRVQVKREPSERSDAAVAQDAHTQLDNGTQPAGTTLKPGTSAPLARQNASLGSLEFLKMLEAGATGEPISFAEVLATNPDWADQNADQSLEAGPPGAARPLDSARNPGGGAEPAGQAVRPSLLDEALKLTGPVGTSKGDAPVARQPSGGRRPGQNLPTSIEELAKYPSFGTQLTKDPSFSSAVFNSLLSQKSEDQAMLLNMLGLEHQHSAPATRCDDVGLRSGVSSQPQTADTGHQSARPQRDEIFQPVQAGPSHQLQSHNGLTSKSPSQITSWQESRASVPLEALPIELPRFSEELEAAQQQPLPPPVQGSAKPLGHNTAAGLVRVHQPTAGSILDSKVVSQGLDKLVEPLSMPLGDNLLPWPARLQVDGAGTSGRRPASAPVQGLAKRARLPDPGTEPPPKPLEQRVGSLDYLLTADHKAQGMSEPSALHQPGGLPKAPELSFAGHEALQMPGTIPPSRGAGNRPQQHYEMPPGSYKAAMMQPLQLSSAGLPPLSFSREKSAQQKPLDSSRRDEESDQRRAKSLCLPPSRALQSSVQQDRRSPPSSRAQSLNGTARASLNGPAPLFAQAVANGNAATEQGRSKFLSGLITGITPKPPEGPSPAQPVAGLRLPKPYVKPLPPLPGMPSIHEYQRKLASASMPASTATPRLEVLPLLGTSTPQMAPVRFDFPMQPNAVPRNGLNGPDMKAPMTWPPLPTRGAPQQAQAPPPGGAMLPRSSMANGLVGLKAASHLPRGRDLPSGDNATDPGGKEPKQQRKARTGLQSPLQKRQAGSASLDAKTSDDGMPEETGDEGLLDGEGDPSMDRRALRKAKNRASAAASRARREAYTASLEEEVKKLQKSQEWLKSRVDKQTEPAEATTTPSPTVRKPQRQLSF